MASQGSASAQQGIRSSFLSADWEVARAHKSSFTGGKAVPTPDEKFLISWCEGNVSVLDIASGEVLLMLEHDEDDDFTTFAVTPDGRIVTTASSRSMMLKHWRLEDGSEVKAWKGHNLPVLDMAYHESVHPRVHTLHPHIHAHHGFAEKRIKVGFNMETKRCGFPQENDKVQVSLGVTHSTDSQKQT